MTLEDFFKPMKLTDEPKDGDYKAIQSYIDEAKIFSDTIYQSIYIIDYYKFSKRIFMRRFISAIIIFYLS